MSRIFAWIKGTLWSFWPRGAVFLFIYFHMQIHDDICKQTGYKPSSNPQSWGAVQKYCKLQFLKLPLEAGSNAPRLKLRGNMFSACYKANFPNDDNYCCGLFVKSLI